MEMFIVPQDFNFFDPPCKAVAGSLETSAIMGLIRGLLRSSEKGVSRLLPLSPVLPPPPSLLSCPTMGAAPPAAPFTQTGGTETLYRKRPELHPQNGDKNAETGPEVMAGGPNCKLLPACSSCLLPYITTGSS